MELMYLRTEEQLKTKPTKIITAQAVITTHIQGRKAIQPRTIPPNLITYGSGKTIYTGPRGGKFYYNSKGKKTYVPKR